VFVVFSLAAAVLLWKQRAPPPVRPLPPPRELTEIVLPGAALLATLDVAALRASPWGRMLLVRLAELTQGNGKVGCTDEVFARAERVAFAIPSEGSTSANLDLGIVAEGRFGGASTIACAESLLRSRGAEPSRVTLGGYLALRARRGRAELAVRDGGPLIVSDGPYFRELVDRSLATVTPGRSPQETVHVRLRSELGPAPLLLTWVLPPGWLEHWLEDPEVSRSPLAQVRALGIRARLSDALSLRAVIAAADADSARRVAEFLTKASQALAPELEAAAPGAEVVIRHTLERIELTMELQKPETLSRWLSSQTPRPRASAGE
jgi:hypothetical protein